MVFSPFPRERRFKIPSRTPARKNLPTTCLSLTPYRSSSRQARLRYHGPGIVNRDRVLASIARSTSPIRLPKGHDQCGLILSGNFVPTGFTPFARDCIIVLGSVKRNRSPISRGGQETP